MNLNLNKKIAIITGAAQGLGKAIALSLAAEGTTVVLADIDAEKAKKVLAEVNTSKAHGMVVRTDISNAEDVNRLVSETIKEYGRIDLLINNAGICPRTEFEDIDEQEWDLVMAVNLKSVFLLSQAVFPYMKSQNYG